MPAPDIYYDIKNLAEFAEADVKRVPTGIPEVDRLCRGPAPGEICMIMGRSYSGKSIIGQNIIHYNKELPSIFFTMEMPTNQALIRLYSMWSDTPSGDVQLAIEQGDFPKDMWDMAEAFPQHTMVGQSGITVQEMSEKIFEFEGRQGVRPEFVVIDYLELLGGAKASGEGYIATEQQATQLKDWAREENMRVFVLHQTNKQEKQWMPPTEDSARNAGYTEADFVLGLWRPGKDPKLNVVEAMSKKNQMAMNILKNRPFFLEKDFIDVRVRPSLRINRKEDYEHTPKTGSPGHVVPSSSHGSGPDPY